MPQIIQVRVKPAEAAADLFLKQLISQHKGVPLSSIQGFVILKKSIDARGKTTWVNLTLQAFINEPTEIRPLRTFSFKDVSKAPKQVIIIGAGPAGLFANYPGKRQRCQGPAPGSGCHESGRRGKP
jgi:uncharacterized FAD-dependent dehydrogenase